MTPLSPDAARMMREAVGAHQNGNLAQAQSTYRRLVEKYPEFPDAWHYSGLLLYQQGEIENALLCLRRAQDLKPDNPGFLVNFGRILYELEDYQSAILCLQQARQLRPGDTNVLLLLAQAMAAVERGGEVLGALEQLAGAGAAQNWQLRMLIGECRDQAGDRAGAIQAYEEAHGTAPREETAPLIHKAYATLRAGETATAEDAFNALLSRDPNCAGAYLGLATLSAAEGNFERTDALCWKAIEHDPHTYQAWTLLAARQGEDTREAFLQKLDRVARESAGNRAAWPLHFARGRLLESGQAYHSAFEAYQLGNRLQSNQHPYSRKHQEDYVKNLIKGMDETFIQRRSRIGVNDPGVIFICGMPRSGTTLVESILAAHPSVNAGGEMRWIHDRLRQSIGVEHMNETGLWLRDAPDEQLHEIATDWAKMLQRAASEKPMVTDKMPGNYHIAGLLDVCFPESPIIYLERDARDNGLSCFTTAFHEGHGFSHTLENIGHYHLLHQRLMAHWDQVLGSQRIIKVRYESLVENPEAEIRRLLEALGLPWEPACLAFHRNRHQVHTASMHQVRQPLYSRSVGRWRAFEQDLEPLLVALSAPAAV